jgi:hypothetical protein
MPLPVKDGCGSANFPNLMGEISRRLAAMGRRDENLATVCRPSASRESSEPRVN